jgi:hypothetical protein
MNVYQNINSSQGLEILHIMESLISGWLERDKISFEKANIYPSKVAEKADGSPEMPYSVIKSHGVMSKKADENAKKPSSETKKASSDAKTKSSGTEKASSGTEMASSGTEKASYDAKMTALISAGRGKNRVKYSINK